MNKLIMSDLAIANLPPGLVQIQFTESIRTLMKENPVVQLVLQQHEDIIFRQSDLLSFFSEIDDDDLTADDHWSAFVRWFAHFFPDQVMIQEITEIGLRKAQVIGKT